MAGSGGQPEVRVPCVRGLNGQHVRRSRSGGLCAAAV